MKRLITNIDTYIKGRELFVSFFVDDEWWEPFIETSFKALIKSTEQISIFELELLKGCYLEPSSFYKRGDKMPDGTMVYEENKFPKTYKVTHDGTWEELKVRNIKNLLTFQSIYSIEVSRKNNKEPYVKIRTTDDKYYFTKVGSFKSLVGINENEFDLLKGSFVSPVMFKKGDSSQYNGRFVTITEDDKIVATFNIRIEGTIEDHQNSYGTPKLKNDAYLNFQRYYGEDDSDNDYKPSYEKYHGYNGWDDDTIDNAFEGDPEATWNVD